jgi:hypothetical protein
VARVRIALPLENSTFSLAFTCAFTAIYPCFPANSCSLATAWHYLAIIYLHPYKCIPHNITLLAGFLQHRLHARLRPPHEALYVGDGFYAKKKVVDKVVEMGFSFISKLRSDADMRYLYEGEHEKRRGAKKKYQGKIIWKDCFDKFSFVTTLENGIKLYSKDVYSVRLKRQLRVVVLQTYNSKGKMGYALLFSTNTEQDPKEIYHYYSLRFSIEFLFRDAKSHLGLQHCQAREEDKLCFHFNFVFLVLNLAKWEILERGKSSISIADLKSEYFNRNYLQTIFTKLDLQHELLKNHPNYPLLENWGKIAA